MSKQIKVDINGTSTSKVEYRGRVKIPLQTHVLLEGLKPSDDNTVYTFTGEGKEDVRLSVYSTTSQSNGRLILKHNDVQTLFTQELRAGIARFNTEVDVTLQTGDTLHFEYESFNEEPAEFTVFSIRCFSI